jgi:hypothetical protein
MQYHYVLAYCLYTSLPPSPYAKHTQTYVHLHVLTLSCMQLRTALNVYTASISYFLFLLHHMLVHSWPLAAVVVETVNAGACSSLALLCCTASSSCADSCIICLAWLGLMYTPRGVTELCASRTLT